MIRRVALSLLIVAALLWYGLTATSLVVSVPPPQRPPAQQLSWLTASEDRIVDELGRTVLLRGFNVSALIDWPSLPPAPFDEVDARLIRDSGFNVVRLPIAWSRLQPRRGEIDRAYLEQIGATVALLNSYALYVVLDMHVSLAWGPRFDGAGAPLWAELPHVPDLSALPSWLREWVSPAPIIAETYFWVSDDWQAEFTQAWRAVAQYFRDNSGVVGYDLYNEPHPHLLPPRLFERRWMWPLYARTIESIGAEDPNHLFIVESSLFLDFSSAVVPLTAPNLVYSPHLYTGSLVPPFSFAPERLRQRVRQQAGEALLVPAAAWWGEFGIDHTRPYAVDWTKLLLDEFDDLQVGWAWWQWRQDRRWGIRDFDGAELDESFLRLLARPFVAAAPGGVRGGRADSLPGSLVVSVDAEHADGPVSISWPTALLPPPLVAGSCVRAWEWTPAAARLAVSLVPGAGCLITIAADEQKVVPSGNADSGREG